MASQVPNATTASICSSETEKATHTFQISGYSKHTGVGVARYICSTRFTVGGHEWRIRYYPDGNGGAEDCIGYVAVYLESMSQQLAEVRLVYDFKLRKQGTSQLDYSDPIFSEEVVFKADGQPTRGTNKFFKKEKLKDSEFLFDDCLEIKCDVTVIKESRLREIAIRPYTSSHVQVPPSNLSDDLFKLFSSGEEADFTFTVEKETFRAHRLVLAIRSPVFKAELSRHQPAARDQRAAATTTCRIEGMEPAVFKALLHFIYTDRLLDEHEKMARKLFAAADRYSMERLKLLCGNILSKALTVQSVTDVLALAHQHRCQELKDACIQFTVSSKRRMAEVLSSEGYKELKKRCSEVALEMLEKSERKKVFKAAIGITNQVGGLGYDDSKGTNQVGGLRYDDSEDESAEGELFRF